MSSTVVMWKEREDGKLVTVLRPEFSVTGEAMCRILVLDWLAHGSDLLQVTGGVIADRVRGHLVAYGMSLAGPFRLSAQDRAVAHGVWRMARDAVLRHWPALAEDIPVELPGGSNG